MRFRTHSFLLVSAALLTISSQVPAQGPSGQTAQQTTQQSSPGQIPVKNFMSRPIFVDGRVQFDDGSPMNTNVRIERVCSGSARLQEHTDSNGNFYFQLNGDAEVDADASADSSSLSGRGIPDHPMITSLTGANPTNTSCEIRAAYPGYRSDSLSLAMRSGSDGIHVGTLVLHRLGGVQGTTMSVTTALAPKHAQKDYEKGMGLVANGKFLEAEHEMQQAATLYPNYALAWFALGQLQQKDGREDEARRSYLTAIKADAHYVSPYVALAQLAGQEKKWDEVLGYSKQTLSLNSVEIPSAYWYNAVANYQLSKWDDAQKSLTELIKLDTTHHFVAAEGLLGRILLQKGDLAGATEHLSAYLTLDPHAPDADLVKRTLDKLALANASASATKGPQSEAPKP